MRTFETPQIAGWRHAARGEQVQLLPGQLHFGAQPAVLRTLLGSCVGITLWHPHRRLGGMCHFLLPSRRVTSTERDGRFADEVIDCLVREIAQTGTTPDQYHTGLYGGADTMPERAGVKLNVGQRNIESAFLLLDRHGFNLSEVDVGDAVPRHLQLDIATGEVSLRRGPARPAQPAPTRLRLAA